MDANRAFLVELPSGGRLGRDRYQAMIAPLIRDQGAYDAQDEAIKALNEENADLALKALDTAVRIQPDEGQFWELRGHAWMMQDNLANAQKAFTTAINKNPDYFQHWLVRGMLHKEQGRYRQAESDLQRSQALLPTAAGAYSLGEIAEQRGDQNSAIAYYQQAASAGGNLGKSAQTKLVRYDLPTNPGVSLKIVIFLCW